MDPYTRTYNGVDYTVHQDQMVRIEELYATNQLIAPRLCGMTLADGTAVYVALGPGIPLTITPKRYEPSA